MQISPDLTPEQLRENLAAVLRRKLERAEAREQRLGTDAAWEANRDVIVALRDQLEMLARRRIAQ